MHQAPPFFLFKLKGEGRKALCILIHNDTMITDITLWLVATYTCGGHF